MVFKDVVRPGLTLFRHALLAAGVVACGSGGGDPVTPVAVSYDVTLAPGAYAVVSGTNVAGALAFPQAGAQGAEYLMIGQLATTSADLTSSFVIRGQENAPPALVEAQPSLRAPSAALRFHHGLRRREAEMSKRAFAYRAPPGMPQLRTPPPVVGSKRTFKVCANLDCTTLKNAPATATFVGTHAAIFVDDSVPSNGFGPADYAQMGGQFDSVLYQIDVSRFGSESDIDGNGVVIVLLSQRINALVGEPECDESFITGFFFGADIDPQFAAQYNNGEVFYGFVPDPSGQVACDYTVNEVRTILPVTFIHEFQHMISYNQHVLVRGGPSEELWLNEGLSHLAEELGGLHYDSANATATANSFLLGNFFNGFIYLVRPDSIPLITEEPPGSLEARGAGWLFVRWLVDQRGPLTTRTLVQTSQVGALNVQAAAGGTPIETLLARWALALYVSDLPGFTAPPELRYTTWNLRATYNNLNQSRPQFFPRPYPLVPSTGQGATTVVTGKIRAGSGAYVLSTQSAGASAFDLFFRRTNSALFSTQAAPQVAVIRIR